MRGLVIGDFVGSCFEYKGMKDYGFPIPEKGSSITDDSIMACAVTEALLKELDMTQTLVKWGLKYYEKDYGPSFRTWLSNFHRSPYGSFGNGSAMRVGGIARIASSVNQAELMAIRSAIPTHNHPEGIKGACAVAVACRMALEGYSKQDIKEVIETNYGYDLSRKLDDIRPSYKYEISCQKSVPESIIAFLESKDFEDAIRLSISLGGDADTMGAITGNIADCFYGTDERLWGMVEPTLPDDVRSVLSDLYDRDVDKQKSPIKLVAGSLQNNESYKLIDLYPDENHISQGHKKQPQGFIKKFLSMF